MHTILTFDSPADSCWTVNDTKQDLLTPHVSTSLIYTNDIWNIPSLKQ